MDCASCKSTIEDDALYCDQCGTELLRCTGCGRLGEKKRCIYCGKPLVAIRASDSSQAAATASGITGAATAQPGSAATGAARVEPATAQLRLSNTRHGIDICPADGDVLGRLHGPHAAVLGRFSQVSANHAQVKRAADGWRVTDLNSFNSTFYNGVRLTPRQEQAIAAGGVLALGDIELRITVG